MRLRNGLIVACLFLASCGVPEEPLPPDPWVAHELGTRAEFGDVFFLDENRGWIVGGGIHGTHIAARLVGEGGLRPEDLTLVDPSAALLDRRMVCYASARRRMSAAVDLFADPTPDIVLHAREVVAGLPDLTRCDTDNVPTGTPLPLSDEEPAVDAIRDLLARSQAMQDQKDRSPLLGTREKGEAFTRRIVERLTDYMHGMLAGSRKQTTPPFHP